MSTNENQDDDILALREIVTNTIRQHQANAATDSAIRSRLASALSGGYDYSDTLHNVYIDFGYPAKVTFQQTWNMYRRFGIARKVVDLPPDTCWRSVPEILASSQFMSEFERLNKRTKFFKRLHSADKRQRVGRYAGLFMRIKDNKKPSEPIDGRMPGQAALAQIVPLYEGQLRVVDTDENVMSENYGMPTMYEYTGGDVGNRNEKQANNFQIHPDRVVIVSEEADNGGIYGISALESCFNSLMDLRKIIGAGGEGFYRNASQSLVHNLKPDSTQNVNTDLLDKMNSQIDDFLRNRMRRSIFTPGIDTTTLQANLANPKEFFNNALNDVSAASDIPATILIGQQTGRLASTEDGRQFLAGQQSRRENFLTEALMMALEWCMRHGILPRSEVEIEWDDLLAAGKNDKLDNASKMATINKTVFDSGGSVPFTGEEIREEAGYESEPEDDDLDDEGEELPPELDDDGE